MVRGSCNYVNSEWDLKMYFAPLPIMNHGLLTTNRVPLAALCLVGLAMSLVLASTSLHAQTSPNQDVLRLRLSKSLSSLDREVKTEPQAVRQPITNCVVLDPELQGSYVGGCKDGLAEGYGEATGMAEYKGGFRAGRKHGKGTKTWPSSGDRYEGEFSDDRKEGFGTYTWGPRSVWAGEKYSGGYLNDRRDGSGVYEWPSGDRYAGTWKNNVITGKPTPRMFARARAYGEAAVAVGIPGTKVCREMTVGIGTRDRVRGTVMTVEADKIVVRIDDAGRFQHTIANSPTGKGGIVRDAPQYWTPCL